MINPYYLTEPFVTSFSQSFRTRQTVSYQSGASVDSSVFPVAVWPSFLQDDQVCLNLRDELAKMDFVLRTSDLYEFHQTIDLKSVTPVKNPLISSLCNELYSPAFLKVMERVTGRRLGHQVDISGQRYQKGDFLLCHDDRLERRRIALILYLVEKDAEMEGGRLWAMRSDEEGRPSVEHPTTVTPKWNTLAFFEVTRTSFHQVEQIYSENVPRYSITCWFHDLEAEEVTENVVSSPTIDTTNTNTIPRSIFPIKFNNYILSQDSIKTLIYDMKKFGVDVFREHVHGKFLSSVQYSRSEPQWMSLLLQDSLHRELERISGWKLDWPTRPVAWSLKASKSHYFLDNGIDRQKDFEYNYKERTRTASSALSTTETLNFSLFLRFKKHSKVSPAKPFFQLNTAPFTIKRVPKPYSKVIIVTMKFTRVSKDLRSS